MLVVYTTCPCETTSVKLEAKEVRQNDTLRCQRMKQNIYRRRPNVCLNYHPEVSILFLFVSCTPYFLEFTYILLF